MRIGIDGRKLADFGIGTYIRGLLGGLAEIAADQTILVFAPASARSLIPAAFEHVVLDAPNYSLRELLVVGRAADAAGLDVFHAPHYVVPLTRVPLVVTVHDLIHLHHRNPLARTYARMMIGRAVRRARRVLTVSEAVKGDITTSFGRADKIVVTPNGIDAVFRADGPRAAGLHTSARYLLFAGNDKPHKNVQRLVEAFAGVRAQEPDVQLVLAGGAFQRFAARDGVVIAGFVETSEELAALMRGARALVQPSLEEGFGLPAAEAMACGTPVITSLAPALVEVTGDAALHVDATSLGALRDAILRVLRDEALGEAMRVRGVARAASFSWRRCAETTLAAYRSA